MTKTIIGLGTRFLLTLFVSASIFVCASAQTNSTEPQITELDVNGMKVLIKRRPGTPTVAAGLFFRGGVQNMTPENAGIEGFTLAAATEGGKLFPLQSLRKETSRIGTSINSASTYDYSAIALACTKPNFERSWAMFVDVALNPEFKPESIERIREAIVSSLRTQNDSPEGTLDNATDKIIYAGHPYSIDPQGTIENITRFSAADLIAYHRKMMQTSRMLLVVVGDVEPEVLRQRIAASFGSLPRGDYKSMPLPPLKFAIPSVDITSKPIQTDYVKGTFAAPSINDPDYFAMRTAITVLQSRVFQEVRVKRNLSYAPDAEINSLGANTAAITVSSVNPNEAIKVMLGEIERLKQGDIDQENIGQMAGYFLTTYYLKEETNAAQVAELAQYELLGGGWQRSLEFLDKIRNVKSSDVQAAANKYMKNIRFVVVGKPADVDRSVFLGK